jgi:2-phospho-L-lactate guanylyltransferase
MQSSKPRATIETFGALIIHADLPFLNLDDVEALIAGATSTGVAIAPDRHGLGTNAIALMRGVNFDSQFGVESYARHRLQVYRCEDVRREGTGFDLDTPADLNIICERGVLADMP